MHIAVIEVNLPYVDISVAEFTETKCIYSNTRTHRKHSDRLLEDGLARESKLHSYAD